MITVQGTVQNGLIKLPAEVQVLEGTRVIVTLPGVIAQNNGNVLPEVLEEEDVRFVRACRGRLAQQLKGAEG